MEILYTCPLADAGAVIELSLGDRRLSGRVVPGWDPPLYTNQDTLPRTHGESTMKEFRSLDLGTIQPRVGPWPADVTGTGDSRPRSDGRAGRRVNPLAMRTDESHEALSCAGDLRCSQHAQYFDGPGGPAHAAQHRVHSGG